MLLVLLCVLLHSVDLQGEAARVGGWSVWTSWTRCTSTCEGGKQMRIRLCNNPFPSNITDKSLQCDEDRLRKALKQEQSEQCNSEIPCPNVCEDAQGESKCQLLIKGFPVCIASQYHQMKDMCRKSCGWCGSWGKWGSFSECSVSCDKGGTRTRRRTCDAYNATIVDDSGQQKCLTQTGILDYGEEEVSLCPTMRPCPVLCNDTQQIETCEMWKEKGYCAPGSKYYTTMRAQCRKSCNLCGNWGSWTPYTTCSTSCGAAGKKFRTRKCFAIDAHSDRPKCLTMDRKLKVDEIEKNVCSHLTPCPVHGQWGEWSYWKCSKLCQSGNEKRTRECDNPPPSTGGTPCVGQREERRTCYVCPGSWGAWSDWTGCDCAAKSFETRQRKCNTRNDQPPSAGCMLPTGVQAQEEIQNNNCTQCIDVGMSQGSSGGPDTTIIGAGAAGGVILLILVVLLIIYLKKRNNKAPETQDALLEKKSNGIKGDGRSPAEGAEDNEPPEEATQLYATPEAYLINDNHNNNHNDDNENEVVYSDPGPGGGRIGYRLRDRDNTSQYASAKTEGEGTYYPPVTSAQEPHTYTLPSYCFNKSGEQ